MSGETTRRTVRVEDDLWEKAKAQAARKGDNLSDIIREALRDYAESDDLWTSHAGATAGAQFQWAYERKPSSVPLPPLDNPYRKQAKR